jgi:carbamate kinase
MEGKGMKIVIALGGNALKKPKEAGTYEETMHNVMVTADQMVALMERGHKLVVTHGNGPQVGAIILQNQFAEPDVVALPMFVCGSESQGMLGFFLQQGLRNELVTKKSKLAGISIATIVTQVEVDKNDPAFQDPTKPIGKFYSKEEAMKLKDEGKSVVEDAGRGWRVVVPSPMPKSIIEKDAIKALVNGGHIVIASGGGGIPVIRDDDDILHGVDAVIDKDLAGEVLAEIVEADMFVILTDVDAAYDGLHNINTYIILDEHIYNITIFSQNNSIFKLDANLILNFTRHVFGLNKTEFLWFVLGCSCSSLCFFHFFSFIHLMDSLSSLSLEQFIHLCPSLLSDTHRHVEIALALIHRLLESSELIDDFSLRESLHILSQQCNPHPAITQALLNTVEFLPNVGLVLEHIPQIVGSTDEELSLCLGKAKDLLLSGECVPQVIGMLSELSLPQRMVQEASQWALRALDWVETEDFPVILRLIFSQSEVRKDVISQVRQQCAALPMEAILTLSETLRSAIRFTSRVGMFCKHHKIVSHHMYIDRSR